MTISELESKLEEYKYPAACDLGVMLQAFDIAQGWLRHKALKESRMFFLRALLEYFRKRDKRQLLYGRVMYWLLGIFETINGADDERLR